jgi:hypothetical protein
MGVFRKLVQSFRDAGVGTTFQRATSLYGSAAAPSPPELLVPYDLRRAVDKESLRRADEDRRAADGDASES